MTRIVYLILPQKRLVITAKKIIDDDYRQLFECDGPGAEDYAKCYCLGYQMCSKIDVKIINTFEEFNKF